MEETRETKLASFYNVLGELSTAAASFMKLPSEQ